MEALLDFGPHTAGGMMTTEIVVVGEDATRGEVVDYIRFHEISPDQLDNIVLINREAKLAGTVPVARLVLAATDQRMAEIVFRAAALCHNRHSRKGYFRTFRQVQFAQPDRGEWRKLAQLELSR